MQKSSKKKRPNFILYRNEVTPQPDTEIAGIDEMDSKKAAQQLQAAKYIDIEKGLDPAVFYELSGLLKGDIFRNYARRFSLSQFHGVSVEVLMDSGFIECRKADLMRALVTTGLLSLCIKGGVNAKCVKNTLSKVAKMSSRVQTNEDHLELLLSKIDMTDDKARTFLRKTIAKYGNNSYGLQVLSRISSRTGRVEKPVDYIKTRNPLSKTGVERCQLISKEPLTDKMYVLDEKKDEKVYSVDVNMSERFWGLLQDYKRVYFAAGTHTQLLRACTVTGLYCLSKWLLKSKICKTETNFYLLSQSIAKYGRDNS